MAIYLEFINIIIPIHVLMKCESIGGIQGFLEINKPLLGETDWYDLHLYRTGVMNPFDIEGAINELEGYGLTPVSKREGKRFWQDVCVIDTKNGLTLPCDWIEIDLNERCAWLKGARKGDIFGRKSGSYPVFS